MTRNHLSALWAGTLPRRAGLRPTATHTSYNDYEIIASNLLDNEVIQRAVHIHPTVTELIPTMLGDLKPLE